MLWLQICKDNLCQQTMTLRHEMQAEVMATQIKKMSPDQIAMLMKLSQLLQRLKTFILSHMALVLAILLLCVAIIYKYFAG